MARSSMPLHQLRSLPLRRLLLLAFMVTLCCGPTRSVSKSSSSGSSGGGKSSGGTGTTTTSVKGSYVYGSSAGATMRLRIITAAVLATVLFHGFNYPAVAFYYDGYYDECALRNLTASQTGLTDSSIDLAAVGTLLPSLIANSSLSSSSTTTTTTSEDIFLFNQTLYNQTNGMIIDSTYCNHTTLTTPGGAGAVRLPVLATLTLALVVAWAMGSGWQR